MNKVYGADRIGIVGFNYRGFVIAKPAEPHASWLLERSQRLHEMIDGETDITDGLRKAIEMCRRTPPGILRRIFLLSDGEPTTEQDALMGVVNEAYRAHVNINTLGFGDHFDEALLRRISGSTHNGKFFSVQTLRELSEALVRGSAGEERVGRLHHRSETTVLCIDLSNSMLWAMNGKSKIAVVEEAILHLIHYKQQCFA